MTRWIRTAAGGAALAAALCGAGCGGDDEGGNGGNRPNPLAVIATASDVSILSVLALQAGTLGPLAFPSAPAPAFALADTVFPPPLVCPTVSATQDSAGGDSLVFNFGEGCTSILDGTLTAGRVAFGVSVNGLGNGLRFTADLDGFSRDGRTAPGGFLDVEERGNFLDIEAAAVFTGGPLDGSVSGTCTAEAAGGAETPYYCRSWTIGSGSGTMTVGDVTFDFNVLDTLLVSTCCPYPVRGTLSVAADGLVPAFFDFGDGTCDSLAVLTIGGDSQTIALGY